jgi:hypothetical protein
LRRIATQGRWIVIFGCCVAEPVGRDEVGQVFVRRCIIIVIGVRVCGLIFGIFFVPVSLIFLLVVLEIWLIRIRVMQRLLEIVVAVIASCINNSVIIMRDLMLEILIVF